MMKPTTYLRNALTALHNAGWTVYAVGSDGQREKVTTITEALVEARALDDAFVMLKKDEARAWLRVVWQSHPDRPTDDADETIADYTVNLEDVLH